MLHGLKMAVAARASGMIEKIAKKVLWSNMIEPCKLTSPYEVAIDFHRFGWVFCGKSCGCVGIGLIRGHRILRFTATVGIV